MADFEHLTVEGVRTRRPQSQVGEDGAPLARLHSSMGNAAIARMLQREAASEDEEEVQAKHDPSAATRSAALAQRESAPGEEEEVQAKHDPSRSGLIAMAQREAGPEEEDELQAKHDGAATQRAPEVGLAGGEVSSGLSERINSQRGGGSALDSSTKEHMEDTLGAPLDGVRVHVGTDSDQLNHAITAKAFTTGNDVFVRSDQYSPGSSSTQRLLAHELTHVVQQRSMSGGEGGMSVGAADTSEEREADAVADVAVQRSAQRETDPEKK